MVINITPYVSFSLTKLFARQGANINKLEHLYRILYATLNNYAECGGKRHDEVKQILHFLVKPKDHTYFLPTTTKMPPSTNGLTSLPTCVLTQTLSLVCERLYDILNCMLVCKAFHNLFSSDLTDFIWYNVSAVAPLFVNCGKDSRKCQNGKPSSGSGTSSNEINDLQEMMTGCGRDKVIKDSDSEEEHEKAKEREEDSDDDDDELEDEDEDEDDEEEEMEYDSDDSEPDHMNSDLNINDNLSYYWTSVDFSLHSDSQNVLLRAIRCKVPAFIIKALLASPENKNFVDEFQRNPIHWCAMNDTQDTDVLKELLAAGISHDKQDKFLRTPLHYALLRGKNEIADMLAAYRPPDSASRGLRTSFDPTIHNNPKYETPPDCSNFIPSSRLLEDDALIQIMQSKTPKVTRRKISRECYLPSKCYNYPKRFLKMDTSYCTVPLGGLMAYSRSNEPFVDLLDCNQFWTQRHIYHPSLSHSLLSDSSLSDCVFLSGSKSLGVWDLRVPRYLVNLSPLPDYPSSFGRTNDKIGYTCKGNAYFTDLRSYGIGEFPEDIVATFSNDKMYWMSCPSQISVYDLNSLSPLAPVQGIYLDEMDPQDRKPMLKATDNHLVCCVRDRVFACDLAGQTHARAGDADASAGDSQGLRMHMVCEVPGVATALAVDKQTSHAAVGNMGLSAVFIKSCSSENESKMSADVLSCFAMTHDDHNCHIDDECYPTHLELHLGALWSTTSCGKISVVPNFY